MEKDQVIRIMRNIYRGRVIDKAELANCNGWQREMEGLLRERQEHGTNGFMDALDILAAEKKLDGYRELVERESKYRPKTILELMQRPRAGFIIEDIFYEKTVGELFGLSGSMKTFLALDWCAHIALNMPWLGHAIRKHGKCVYTAAEGGDNFIKRVLAWCRYHNVSPELLSNHLFIVEEELPLSSSADVSEYIAEIGEFIHNVSPVVVVFDTLMRCSGGGNINLPDVMNALYNGANSIRKGLDAAHTLIVHHEGKDATRGAAGSFVLRSNCDIVHRLTRDVTTGTLTLTCKQENQGKMKDYAEYPDIYLNTRPVYYTDAQTKNDSSLVIVSGTEPQAHIKLTKNRQEILDALTNDMSYSDWKKAVDTARKGYGIPPMPKQTFIDNMKWLVDASMVRKEGTDDPLYFRTCQEGE